VRRNRLKRQLRELVRTRLLPAMSAGDVVIRARREAYDVDIAALTRDIETVREAF
jgi:ribonuclease P protein component